MKETAFSWALKDKQNAVICGRERIGKVMGIPDREMHISKGSRQAVQNL